MSILSKIQTGRIGRPQKVTIYAPEGFGKSTLAGLFPNPLFLDIEGSTAQLDVARIGRESLPTLASVESVIDEIIAGKPCATLVIDTVDWLETMINEAVIAEAKSAKITSIEDFGYGKGYVMVKEKFTVLLSRFDRLIQSGINVVLLAHSVVKKFEPPDGAGAYDRYELKLSKHVAPLVKEWSDALIFGNYRTQVRERDKHESGQQFKGVGGRERKLYATRCAVHDAKNRHGLADEEAWSIDTIKKAFRAVGAPWGISIGAKEVASDEVTQKPAPEMPQAQAAEPEDDIPMVHDTDKKGIVSPEEIEFHRVCEPREAAVNRYLRQHPNPQLRIGEKQTFRDASMDYMKRVLRNPTNFITAVEAVK